MDGRWEQEEGDEERGKKKMTCGARVSVTGERGCDEVYVFIYAAAGPRPCPYVFCGIFVGNEEL